MKINSDFFKTLLKVIIKYVHKQTETIMIQNLNDFVYNKRIQGLKEYRGKFNLDIKLNTIRKR